MDRICIGLVVYLQSGDVARRAVAKFYDPSIEVVFIEGVMEDILNQVSAAKEKGVEVFLASGANYDTLAQHSDVPIIKMQVTTFEYLKALQVAAQMGGRIVFPYYKDPVLVDIETLHTLTDLEIMPLEFESPGDLLEKLAKIKADVVVGGALACATAKQLKIKSLLVVPSEETVINSLKEAKQIALTLRREREKAQTMKAILDYTLNGVIATNRQGVVTLFNPAAAAILMMKSSQVLGKKIEEAIPALKTEDVLNKNQPTIGEIVTINNTEIIVNKVPLNDHHTNTGCILIFQKVSDIVMAEQQIRAQNKQKGLVAKANFSDIIGRSKRILQEIEKAKMYASTDSNILIYGETGVGKELFAQSIHNHSPRQSGPFVAINCVAIPDSLMESELFGYEEGAFTGSKKGGKIGLFELAHRGTIFLDEISEIPGSVQARLLRVIQEKEVMRVGGERVIPIDVRIIAATNSHLEEKVPHQFREDLFFRLEVLTLDIPPLRQRGSDILEIFMHFLSLGLNIFDYRESIYPESLAVLRKYSWPGNIRELYNVSERFIVQLKNTLRLNESTVHELLVQSIGQERLCNDILKQYNYEQILRSADKKKFRQLYSVLEEVFPGKKSYLAQKLGISRTTLWRMTKE